MSSSETEGTPLPRRHRSSSSERRLRCERRLILGFVVLLLGGPLLAGPELIEAIAEIRDDLGHFYANLFAAANGLGWTAIATMPLLLSLEHRRTRSRAGMDVLLEANALTGEAAMLAGVPARRRTRSVLLALPLALAVALFLTTAALWLHALALHVGTWELAGQDRWDEAVAHVDKAIARFPRAGVLHGDRAWVLRHLGRYPEALASARLAVELDPQVPTHRHLMTELLDMSGPNLAAVRARVRDWPDEDVPDHRVQVAQRLLLLDRTAGARRWLERALREDPILESARIAMAEVEVLDGRPVEALAWLEPVPKGSRFRWLTTRAIVHRCVGRTDEARCDLEDATTWAAGARPRLRRLLEAQLDVIDGHPTRLPREHFMRPLPGNALVNWELMLRLAAQCPPMR